MSGELSPAFADVLRACREEINARFALMRHEFPHLDGDAFAEFLRRCGDPLVRAVEAVDPHAVPDAARATCEAGLELVARNFAGPKARHRWIDETWQRVLTLAARAVAARPQHVIGALSNAMHQIATTPEARPAQWLALMEEAARLAADVDALLQAGQVAAWRSGLAHFREAALALAGDLPPALALAALGAQGDAGELLAQLREDAWFDPAQPEDGSRLLARAGAFRGFGGPFLQPPVVTLLHGQWLAHSGDEHWLVTADAFGATFHRTTCPGAPPPSLADRQSLAKLSIPPGFGAVTSIATNGATAAVTASLTHAVLFFRAAP